MFPCYWFNLGQTFVRPDVLQHYEPPKASQMLCGVTRHCTEVKGPVHVRIKVVGRRVVLPVYVEEMEDQCILSLDYLASMACQMDLVSMKLLVQGRPVPVRVLKRTSPGSEVRALRTTIIPPRIEKLIHCGVSGPFDGFLGLVEPDSRGNMEAGVMVGRTLVEAGSEEVLVVAANFSDAARRISKG